MPRHTPERLALLQKMLAQKGISTEPAGAIPRREGDGPARVSFGQRRLWFLEQLEPGTSLYNDSLCVSLRGAAIDRELFERSLQKVVERHEVLRTTFPGRDGEPVQLVHPAGAIPLRHVDLEGLEPGEAEAELERLLREDVRGSFDLERLPLVRGTLVRRSEEAWEFALTMHHIVSDGVSYAILWRELGEEYAAALEGRPSSLHPLPIQFGDYAEWERDRVDEARIREGLAFWRAELGEERPVVELPVDFPRPPRAQHRGAFHRFRFPGALVRSLDEHCRREHVTSNWILLAAYYALLHSYSGQEDITVGMPSSTRTERELEELIGFFVQTVLLRNDLGGDPSFRELVALTRRKALRASPHEDVPFDRVVQAIRPEGAVDAPLIQAWIAPMKDLMPRLRLPGASSSYRIVDPGNARFDLCLILDETSEGIEAYFEYDVDLFRPATVESIARRYLALLQRVVERPETRLSTLRETLEREVPRPAEEPRPRRSGPKRIARPRRRTVEG